MLDLTITSRLEGETEAVAGTPNMGMVLRMELFFKLDSGIKALEQMKLEHLCWLAWETRRSDGHTVPTFDKFKATLADMNFESNTDPLADEGPPIG
jgi:hypothetical protein